MNSEKIVKLTNRIALVSVGLLVYWVFVFISITVFEFKVFRENITQAFYLSILGIFALLGAAIILNIMFNLTRIAESKIVENKGEAAEKKQNKKGLMVLLLLFPVLFLLLYLGDLRSSQVKKEHLISSAKHLVAENQNVFEALSNYDFKKTYIEFAAEQLEVLSKIEESFPRVNIIVKDTIGSKSVFLLFNDYDKLSKEEEPKKCDYIYSTGTEEREYLTQVFNGQAEKLKFSASDGSYELYFPVKSGNNIIIVYLSQHRRYGKIGS